MTEQKNKPVLDEQTFEKLLEAAYVMQEHNRKMRELELSLESQSEQLREQELAQQALLERTKPIPEEQLRPKGDYTLTLAQIVEAQHQIQIRHLQLDSAMGVVAERVARITNASGAGIGILEGKVVRYRAGAGSPALPAGSEVPLRQAICQANIRTGQVIRSEDVNIEILFDPEPCVQRGILSLLAVPIYHDGNIIGSLELYFDRPHGFAEQDIHTCQLMAGLVTEAMGREVQANLKESMATERSNMQAEMERLKPIQPATGNGTAAVRSNGNSGATETSPCWKCGNRLMAEDQFCGKCGASRSNDAAPSSVQSKLASAWLMQQGGQSAVVDAAQPFETSSSRASRGDDGHVDFPDTANSEADYLSSSVQGDSLSMAASQGGKTSPPTTTEGGPESGSRNETKSTALAPKEGDEVWSSAAKAREFLESVSGVPEQSALVRFWNSRRGDFYLGFALILVVVVIRWGIWSEHSVGAAPHGTTAAAKRKQAAADADLSAFDKLLISLGLAEAPEAPEYRGNPDTQVWVDLHTALYYCPGSELYGKTPKGKMTSQRDAQLDQFESASRKACD